MCFIILQDGRAVLCERNCVYCKIPESGKFLWTSRRKFLANQNFREIWIKSCSRPHFLAPAFQFLKISLSYLSFGYHYLITDIGLSKYFRIWLLSQFKFTWFFVDTVDIVLKFKFRFLKIRLKSNSKPLSTKACKMLTCFCNVLMVTEFTLGFRSSKLADHRLFYKNLLPLVIS